MAKVLTNVFSREKSLLYFCMWDDSDRKGLEILGRTIRNNLFIVPPKGEKGSVWYEQLELAELKQLNIDKLNNCQNKEWLEIRDISKHAWDNLKPYANREKIIDSPGAFETYYCDLVDFWVCLNSILYEVSENEHIDQTIRDWLCDFRIETESHSEDLSSLMMEYVRNSAGLEEIADVLTKKEITRFLDQNLTPEELAKIKNRKNGCFMFNGEVYLSGELNSVLDLNNLALEKIEHEGTEINGNIAFTGTARGRVKIIKNFDDLSSLSLGDILVTEMTNPKYTSAITQCAGIITDQGGLLCHAAIVARELKKPCIIGTKVATKVLKDGDLVEVDANNGIVKIIQ